MWEQHRGAPLLGQPEAAGRCRQVQAEHRPPRGSAGWSREPHGDPPPSPCVLPTLRAVPGADPGPQRSVPFPQSGIAWTSRQGNVVD